MGVGCMVRNVGDTRTRKSQEQDQVVDAFILLVSSCTSGSCAEPLTRCNSTHTQTGCLCKTEEHCPKALVFFPMKTIVAKHKKAYSTHQIRSSAVGFPDFLPRWHSPRAFFHPARAWTTENTSRCARIPHLKHTVLNSKQPSPLQDRGSRTPG